MGLSEKTKRAPSAPVWNQSFPSLIFLVFVCLLLCCMCVVSLPKYLAPEVLCMPVRNEPFRFVDDGCVYESFQDTSSIHASSARADVWSLGIILLEFLLVSSASFLACWCYIMQDRPVNIQVCIYTAGHSCSVCVCLHDDLIRLSDTGPLSPTMIDRYDIYHEYVTISGFLPLCTVLWISRYRFVGCRMVCI